VKPEGVESYHILMQIRVRLEGIFDILFCLLEAQVVPSEATLCPQVFWSVGEKKKRNMG
jgi:hypothetical protein